MRIRRKTTRVVELPLFKDGDLVKDVKWEFDEPIYARRGDVVSLKIRLEYNHRVSMKVAQWVEVK